MLKRFSSLFLKEFSTYLYSLLSYVFLAVFLLVLLWIFFQNFFVLNQTSMRGFFALAPWFFLFFIPTLTMRSWSEEKKTGTLETLLVLPYHEWHFIAAKFLAGCAFLLVSFLLTVPVAVTLSRLGHLDIGQTLGEYIALFFFGASIFSLGMFISSRTSNQIIALLITLAIGFVIMAFGIPFFAQASPFINNILQNLSPLAHYQSMMRGVLDIRDVVFFLSFIILFLVLNSYSLSERHWK